MPRRLLAAALLLMLGGTACEIASASSSPIPGPSGSIPAPDSIAVAGAGQSAEAVWIFLRRSTGSLFFAAAYREAEAGAFRSSPFGGLRFVGVVGRGTCHVLRRPHVTVVSCSGRGWAREISPGQFEVDPALSSATLTMRAARRRNVVRWEGRGPGPVPGGGAAFGPDFVAGGVGAARGARAVAHLFGRHVRRRGGPFTYLAEGAGGFAFVEPSLGGFRWERDFRLPA